MTNCRPLYRLFTSNLSRYGPLDYIFPKSIFCPDIPNYRWNFRRYEAREFHDPTSIFTCVRCYKWVLTRYQGFFSFQIFIFQKSDYDLPRFLRFNRCGSRNRSFSLFLSFFRSFFLSSLDAAYRLNVSRVFQIVLDARRYRRPNDVFDLLLSRSRRSLPVFRPLWILCFSIMRRSYFTDYNFVMTWVRPLSRARARSLSLSLFPPPPPPLSLSLFMLQCIHKSNVKRIRAPIRLPSASICRHVMET